MLPTIILWCLVAAPALGALEKGLVVRFDGDDSSIGKTAFFDVPKSQDEAIEAGWVQVPRPQGQVELGPLASLVMWCPHDDYTFCLFTDDTGYIAGTQTALDETLFSDTVYDWKTQGFTYWPVQVNGANKNYWTAQHYYVTPTYLAKDPARRIAARRQSNTLLPDRFILISGINGKLLPITTNGRAFTDGKTDFTVQSCVDKMGYHYAYKMSNATVCGADQLLPWLPLVHNNQLIGTSMVLYSKHTPPTEGRNWFEILDDPVLKSAIPNAPGCLYDLPYKSGLITLHTYFLKRPYDIKC